jgi:hypothetical protein
MTRDHVHADPRRADVEALLTEARAALRGARRRTADLVAVGALPITSWVGPPLFAGC